MEISLIDLPHYMGNLLAKDEQCPPCLLPVLGKPLLVHNLEKIMTTGKTITKITIPSGFSSTSSLLQTYFPSIQIDESKEDRIMQHDMKNFETSDKIIEMPILSYVTTPDDGNFQVNPIVYPWEWLLMMQAVLQSEVKSTIISKDSSIKKTSVIDGPCIIEDGAYIDDFVKIKGPVYIGRKTTIGTSCLIRGSMIGENCSIGYNNEAARTYLTEDCIITHQDTLLDSMFGQGCWVASYVVTANNKWNDTNIKCKMGDKFIDTGLKKLGGIVGYGCKIGTTVTIYPGRSIAPDSIIPSTTIVQ